MSQFPPPTNGENPYALPADRQIEFLDSDPLEGKQPAPRMGSRLLVLIAWLVILSVGGFMFAINFLSNLSDLSDGEMKAEMQQVNSAAKTAISDANSSRPDMTVLESIRKGPYEHRLCFVLLQSELEGIQDAKESLADLGNKVDETNYELDETQQRLSTLVRKLLDDYEKEDWAAGSLTGDDRKFLIQQLGYSAKIGLAPSEGMDRAGRQALIEEANEGAWKIYFFVAMLLLLLLSGLICSSIMAVLMGVKYFADSRLLRSHFDPDSRRGRIYGETFAVWICCFLFGPLLLLLPLQLADIDLGSIGTAAIGVGTFFGSLLALAWPCFRGISFKQVREDIGWTLGNPFKETAIGVFAYMANLPILIAGLIAAGVLNYVSEQMQDKHELDATRTASHPIVEQIAQGDITLIFLVIMTACVAAPIVEETVFRGLLYRHLREVSLNWARSASVIFSTILNSVIFAAIHPQGWTAIPVLASIAVGFSWAREWRGSLIAPMVMHAVNNGIISMVMILMLE